MHVIKYICIKLKLVVPLVYRIILFWQFKFSLIPPKAVVWFSTRLFFNPLMLHCWNFVKSSIKTKQTHIFLNCFNSAENSFEEGEASIRQLLSNSTIPSADILFAYQLYFCITDNLHILQHTYSISAMVTSLPWDQTGARKRFKHLRLAHKNCVCVLAESGDNISVDGERFLHFFVSLECCFVVWLVWCSTDLSMFSQTDKRQTECFEMFVECESLRDILLFVFCARHTCVNMAAILTPFLPFFHCILTVGLSPCRSLGKFMLIQAARNTSCWLCLSTRLQL